MISAMSAMSAFSAIALSGFHEARRNRVSAVVGVFAAVLLLASTLVTEVTVYTLQRVLTDFGLATMSGTLVLLSVFLSCSLMSKEIDRRTIFMIVSKPISRSFFVFARVAGNVLTLATLLGIMTALFLVQVRLFGAPVTPSMLVAIIGILLEVVLLSSVGTLMSSFSNAVVSSVVTIGAFFIGHLSSDVYALSARSEWSTIRATGRFLYYAFPNFSRINFRPQAAYDITPALSEVTLSAIYALLYSGLLVMLAAAIFQRRDFK